MFRSLNVCEWGVSCFASAYFLVGVETRLHVSWLCLSQWRMSTYCVFIVCIHTHVLPPSHLVKFIGCNKVLAVLNNLSRYAKN